MDKLLLLASEYIETNKYYLYAMEMQYHNIIRIVKFDKDDRLYQNWSVGCITEVESMTRWGLEKNVYITRNDRISVLEVNELTRILLNKSCYPQKIMLNSKDDSFGIIRLSNVSLIEFEDSKSYIEAKVWGSKEKIKLRMNDSKWKNFWQGKENNLELVNKYKALLSSYKNDVFVLVSREEGKLSAKGLIVL